MKNILSILCLLTSFQVSFANNPTYAVGNIPDSLLVNANAVVRLAQEKFIVTDIGHATTKVKTAITIFNNKSSYEDLQIAYDQFKKIGKIKALIYDANGNKIREIKKNEIKDYAAFDGFSVYNDSRLKHIDFTYGSYPYTIEYEYSIAHDGLMYYAFWHPQNYKTSVENSIFQLTLPTTLDFHFKAKNIQTTPKITTNNGHHTHAWQISNRVVVAKEANAPSTYQPLPFLYAFPNEFEVDGYRGSMENWQSYGQFMYALNNNRDELSPKMATKVKSLIAKAQTDEEKINILYAYLKENMRYVSVQLGIGGWQTFDATYVEENKYGDCKALTNFMKGMLKTAGIKAYASLIHRGPYSIAIESDFTAPLFNHVILHIPKEDIWLECTSNSNPVNYLGGDNEDRPTLLITEKGGVLTKTPAITNNIQQGKTQITLQENGGAKVTCNTKFTGKLHDYYRMLIEQASPEEQEKWFIKNQAFPTLEIEKLNFSAAPDKPEASCVYNIQVNRYASKAGKRLFVPLNLVNPFYRSLPKVDNRQQPVAFKQVYTDEDEIIFQLPPSYKVESLPKNKDTITSPYGEYTIEIIEKNDTIIYKRLLKLNAVSIPAAEYEQLRAFYQQIAKMDKAKLVLVRRSA